MAKTLNERIAETKEKISQYENQVKQLVQKQKETERKARTHRLIERGAILESLLDGADTLTNEDVKTILTAALSSGDALDALILIKKQQNAAVVTEPGATRGAGA